MEYTILKLSKLAGISTRTLRYYDEIGLLPPLRTTQAGYRVYGDAEVNALEQILYFRELGMSLTDIRAILAAPDFDRLLALRGHLAELTAKRNRYALLIRSVEKAILREKGQATMSDKEKFEAFKQDLVRKNEEQYGREVRRKYGGRQADEANAKMMNLTQEQYGAMQTLSADIIAGLESTVTQGLDPAGAEGKRLARMHREFISCTLKHCTKEMHLGIARMYADDERFTAYYDAKVPGCAAFLRDAVTAYYKG